MADEVHELAINPIVQDSINHNARTIQNIRSLSSSLLGICAGTLHLTSYAGFAFYLFGTLFVSLLIFLGPAQRKPEGFFYNARRDMWGASVEGLGGGVLGYVLTWTLFFNLVGGA